MAYELPPEGVPQALAGLYMLGLAIVVLWLNHSSRMHRALAVFLSVRGLANLLQGLTPAAYYAEPFDPYHPLLLGPAMGEAALPAATLYFAITYRRRMTERSAPVVLPWLLLAWVVLLEIVVLLNPTIFSGADHVPGPLLPHAGLKFALYLLAAAWFFRDAVASPDAGRRRAMMLAGLALALGGVLVAGHSAVRVWYVPDVPANAWLATTGRAVQALALLVLVPALPPLARQAWRGGDAAQRREATAALAALGIALVVGIVGGGLARATPAMGSALLRSSEGLATLMMPLLLSFAIFRHGLLQGDPRAHVAVRGSTLAGVGLGIFILVTQLAEGFAENVIGEYGWLLGAVSAALLLILMQPVQRLAERISTPGGGGRIPASDLPPPERLELYRDQARLAWADGSLTTQERRLLDGLRGRLGISAEDAHRIESEVAPS